MVYSKLSVRMRMRQFRHKFCQDCLTIHMACLRTCAGYSLLSSGMHVPCTCASMLIYPSKFLLFNSLLLCLCFILTTFSLGTTSILLLLLAVFLPCLYTVASTNKFQPQICHQGDQHPASFNPFLSLWTWDCQKCVSHLVSVHMT